MSAAGQKQSTARRHESDRCPPNSRYAQRGKSQRPRVINNVRICIDADVVSSAPVSESMSANGPQPTSTCTPGPGLPIYGSRGLGFVWA